ncbi:glutamate receptor-like isoform X2 [Palaemon carinicauda]|uniref:glutamate receptor-like isoform X2 n=1 Tax=Palaemon carinicauda TaxID=392227 RepID=UPI0035B629E3
MEGDIEEEDMKESLALLETLVPEGTHVRIFVRNTEGALRAFLSFVDMYGVTRFKYDAEGLTHLTWGSPENEPHHYSLDGRQLTLAVTSLPLVIDLGRRYSDGSVEIVSGGDATIINCLSSSLNFTYKAFYSIDNSFGNVFPNGTATGIIGMVARREVTFGAGTIAITRERERVVDFTGPYMVSRTMLFSRFPKEKNRALAVLSPYQFQVWVSFATTVLFMGPVAYLVSLLTSKNLASDVKPSLQWYSFNMFRNIANQALYSGVLTAVLAVPSYETPIDSLTDLPRATKEGFTIGMVGGTSNEEFFKAAKEGIYKQIWDIFKNQDYSTSFTSGIEEGMKRVLQGKYVFFAGENFKRVYTRRFGNRKYYFSRDKFFRVYVSFPFQSGSPITAIFTHFLLRLQETGIMGKWIEDIFQTIPLDPSARKEETKSFSITLNHLQAGFYLFVMGLLVAFVVLLFEVLVFFSKVKRLNLIY